MLARYEEDIEKNLKAVFQGKDIPLYNMMSYQMGWIDEQGENMSSGVHLPSKYASDFASFCQKNPKPCPLIGLGAKGAPSLKDLGDIDISDLRDETKNEG